MPAATRTISLNEAITAALNANLDLALARAQEEIAKAHAGTSTGKLLPSIDVNGGISHTEGLVQGSFGDFQQIDSNSSSLGVTIGMHANIGARVLEMMASRHEVSATSWETGAATQQLLLRVLELYENLVLTKSAVDIASELVKSSTEFEHIATVRQEGGIGLGADVARAKANRTASEQQLVQAQNLQRDASISLAVVLRCDPATQLVPTDTTLAAWQLPPLTDAEAPSLSPENNPSVEAQREHVQAARRELQSRWWDLVAPELVVEWRYTGIAGDRIGERPDTGPALSTAAGSVGRSINFWQTAGTALTTPGTNPLPSLSNAAGSGGRAYYAYKNLLEHPHDDIDGLHDQERYGVWLNWNLSYTKVARIREQRATAKAADLRLAKTEDEIAGEIQKAQNDIQSGLRLIALAKDEIDAAETNHRLSLARFTAGTALAFEVLDAQDTLAQARLKLVRYITEFNLAQARLLTLARSLNPEDVPSLTNTH